MISKLNGSTAISLRLMIFADLSVWGLTSHNTWHTRMKK